MHYMTNNVIINFSAKKHVMAYIDRKCSDNNQIIECNPDNFLRACDLIQIIGINFDLIKSPFQFSGLMNKIIDNFVMCSSEPEYITDEIVYNYLLTNNPSFANYAPLEILNEYRGPSLETDIYYPEPFIHDIDNINRYFKDNKFHIVKIEDEPITSGDEVLRESIVNVLSTNNGDINIEHVFVTDCNKDLINNFISCINSYYVFIAGINKIFFAVINSEYDNHVEEYQRKVSLNNKINSDIKNIEKSNLRINLINTERIKQAKLHSEWMQAYYYLAVDWPLNVSVTAPVIDIEKNKMLKEIEEKNNKIKELQEELRKQQEQLRKQHETWLQCYHYDGYGGD